MLAVQVLGALLNRFGDEQQRELVRQDLQRREAVIARTRQDQPDLGILIVYYYHQIQAPPDSLVQPSARYSHLRWAAGRTADEARDRLARQASMTAAPPRGWVQRAEQQWIPPLRQSGPADLEKPFPAIGTGTFVPGRTIFQDVVWGGMMGFEDGAERTLRLPAGAPVRFVVLEAPRTIHWFTGARIHTETIPVVTCRTANGRDVRAVDLDLLLQRLGGDTAAVPIFPADEVAWIVFRATPATRDNLRQLRRYVNIGMMRWIRPENLVLDAP